MVEMHGMEVLGMAQVLGMMELRLEQQEDCALNLDPTLPGRPGICVAFRAQLCHAQLSKENLKITLHTCAQFCICILFVACPSLIVL